ncbi:hypothetical protein FWF89_03360 [Candidatus Saccharibacteria bacterium]|nr:hypothetical protein [Candidatus Saccharibacteria bacterium]
MSEIDYEELDKEVGKVMADDGDEKHVITKRMEAEEEGVEASEMHVKPQSKPAKRGRYMDMVHPTSDMRPPSRNYSVSKEIEAPEEIETESVKEEVEEEDEPEFGVIEDVNKDLEAEADFVSKPEAMKDLPEKEEFEDFDDEEEPDANNYSLGGKSPFIPDAKVEKRPLGDYVPEGSARGVQSTKNVYSQRVPMEEIAPDVKPTVIGTQRKSGWIWAIVTILVIAAGGGLGVLAFMLYTNQ